MEQDGMSEEPKRVPHDVDHAPNRCWFKTEQLPTGEWLWGSREWERGEVAELLRGDGFTKPAIKT